MSEMQTMATGSRGLADVPGLELREPLKSMLEMALARSGGSRPWRQRKEKEAHDILALGQLCPEGRMMVRAIDLSHALRAMIRLDCPVACREQADSADPKLSVAVRRGVEIGLTYPQAVLSEALPGYAFIEILQPRRVFHPNVAPEPEQVQRLCLGATLPARIRCTDLVVMAYDALRMAQVQADEYDPAGVLNLEASRHWQVNGSELPLSRAAFLEAGL